MLSFSDILLKPTPGNSVGNTEMNKEQKASAGGYSLSWKQPRHLS